MSILDSIFGGISDLIIKATQVARDDPHYTANMWTSQLRARRNPWSSCFSHATAWFLANAGIDVTPDEVTAALNDDPVYQAWGRTHYGASTYNSFQRKDLAQMLWELQQKYINDKLGAKNTCVFDQNTELNDLKAWIARGPIIVNTEPMYQGRKLGHIMLITGRTADGWIVDDSFGYFPDGYSTGKSGDDIKVTFEDFEKIRGRMAIHFLRRN